MKRPRITKTVVDGIIAATGLVLAGMRAKCPVCGLLKERFYRAAAESRLPMSALDIANYPHVPQCLRTIDVCLECFAVAHPLGPPTNKKERSQPWHR